jgi:hypothetical protein
MIPLSVWCVRSGAVSTSLGKTQYDTVLAIKPDPAAFASASGPVPSLVFQNVTPAFAAQFVAGKEYSLTAALAAAAA